MTFGKGDYPGGHHTPRGLIINTRKAAESDSPAFADRVYHYRFWRELGANNGDYKTVKNKVTSRM